MKRNKLELAAFTVLALLGSHSARADLLYQYTTGNAQSALVSSFDAGTQVYFNVGYEGVSGNTHLVYATYTPASGYKYWNGVIPASAVSTTGITGMRVNVDTCTINPTYACGLVDVTVNKDPASVPMINTGVSQTVYGDVLYQTAGSYTTYQADATGSINGIAFNTTNRAWIGRYNNVTVTISSGN